MLRTSLCNYSDAYILTKGTITVAQETAAAPNNANKKVIFRNCAPFTNCISTISTTQIVMSMYILIEYGDNCSKTSGILWQ